MSGPLFTVRSALRSALVAGVIGAVIAVMFALDAPAWLWSPLVVFLALTGLVFVLALGQRDPEHRLRGFVLRTAVLVGATLVVKATAGLTVDAAGQLDLPPWLSGVGRLALGSPWPIDLGCLIGGVALLLVPAWLVRTPAAPVAAEPERGGSAGEDGAAAAPAPVAEVFRERVRLLFEKRAFTSFALDRYDAEAGCWIGESRDASGTRRVVIRCDDRGGEVGDDDLAAAAAFAAKLPGAGEPRVYYTTPGTRRVGAEVAERHRAIECTSEAALLDSLVHFDGYLNRVIERYESDRLPYSTTADTKTLAGTFVAPRYALHGVAGAPPRAALRDYLDEWLADPRPRQIALLADYGMGKSSFLKHYARYLAGRRLAGDGVRIPILLSLTGKSPRNRPGVEGLIEAFIGQYALRCEYAAFELLMKAGRLVFLIDAFDEMDLVGDRALRLAHFAELWRLHMPGNKLLFAGRPTFFPDDAELREALHIAELAPDRMAGRGYCERLSLTPLEDADIARSFASYFAAAGAEHFDWVRTNPRLLDLARRPAMMHIIRETIDELRSRPTAAVELREAALLKLYTDHWVVRQEGARDRQLLVSSELRARFSESLAVWMFTERRTSVESRELGELFERWFPDEAARVASGGAGASGRSLERAQLLQGIETDLRNCTFLVGGADGKYVFAHKPFYEFFVAAAIDRGLRDGTPLPEAIQARRWGTEICLHVADLWLLRRGGVIEDDAAMPVFRAIARATLRGRLWQLGDLFRRAPKRDRENPERDREDAVQPANHRVRHWQSLLDAMLSGPPLALVAGPLRRVIAMSAEPRENALQVLLRAGVSYRWIQRRLFNRLLAAISPLGERIYSPRCLDVLDLTRANFDHATLTGVALSGRSLIGATFVDAELRECRLDRADLSEADLTRCRAHMTAFDGARLVRARLTRAQLSHCQLERVDARGARLEHSLIAHGSMRFARLRGAALTGAQIHTDVSGADAVGVDHHDEAFRQAAAIRARLPGFAPKQVELRAATLARCGFVAWSPDDTMLLAISRGSVWLLDAGNGALIERILDRDASIIAATFRSSSQVVTVNARGRVCVHDLETRAVRARDVAPDAHAVALAAGGRWIAGATRGSGTTVVRVEPVDGAAPGWSARLERNPDALAVSSDGARAAALISSELWLMAADGSRHGTLESVAQRWDSLVFHPDGRRIAVIARSVVEIFSVDDFVAPSPRPIARLPIDEPQVAFSPDGRWLVAEHRGRLVFRSCQSWREHHSVPVAGDRIGNLAVAGHSHEVACGLSTAFGSSCVIAIASGERELSTQLELGADLRFGVDDARPVTDLTLVDDHTLTTEGLGTKRTWDLDALAERSSVIKSEADRPPGDDAAGLPIGSLKALRLRPGKPIAVGPARLAELVAIAGSESWTDALLRPIGHTRIRVYDTEASSLLADLPAQPGDKLAVFRPDGGCFAFLNGDDVVVHDLVASREIARVVARDCSALAFTSDGGGVVFGDGGGNVSALAGDGRETARIQLAGGRITELLALPRDRLIIATADGGLHEWTLGDAAVRSFAGQQPAAVQIAVSPSERTLACICRDDVVRVYDLAARTLTASLYHLEAGWAALRADGKYRHGGNVSRLSCVSALRAYRLDDIDLLRPDLRL